MSDTPTLIAPAPMRSALRKAVQQVLGRHRSAVIGDLAAELQRAGWSLVRVDDCQQLLVTGLWRFDSDPWVVQGSADTQLRLNNSYALVPLPSPEDTGGDE